MVNKKIMRQRKRIRMYELVESWRSSGQSKRDFSKARGIKPHVLYYWIKQYEQHNSRAPIDSAPSKFIPLQVSSPLSTVLTIVYPNGVQVQLPNGLDTEQLSVLIQLGGHV